jgi:hypothetical protein
MHTNLGPELAGEGPLAIYSKRRFFMPCLETSLGRKTEPWAPHLLPVGRNWGQSSPAPVRHETYWNWPVLGS